MSDRSLTLGWMFTRTASSSSRVAAGGLRGEVAGVRPDLDTSTALDRLLRKLVGAAEAAVLATIGPCGVWLQRRLSTWTRFVVVASPPRGSPSGRGDLVKTDRRMRQSCRGCTGWRA